MAWTQMSYHLGWVRRNTSESRNITQSRTVSIASLYDLPSCLSGRYGTLTSR